MEKRLTVGVLAHVDAGKTTFSEQVLYHAGSIRKRGRVDNRDTLLDSDEMEKERGITIFSNHAAFDIGKNRYYLLDTPGHADFSAEMERAVQAMDYAVVLVSCVEGIQAHTEKVWRLLEKYRLPVLFFLNKTDREGADPDGVLAMINKRMGKVCDCTSSFEGEEWSEELIEQVAGEDEELLEIYLDGGYDKKLWEEKFAEMIGQRKLFAAVKGSALQDKGIDTFLKMLDALTLPKKESEKFSAAAWQVRHNSRGERLVFLKINSGTLKARDEVAFTKSDGSEGKEKVNEIRLCQGGHFTTVQQVSAGEICAVTGLDSVKAGGVVGEGRPTRSYQLMPMLGAKVILPQNVAVRKALEKLRELEDEDPMLGVSFEESLQEIDIRVMGEIQLEVLSRICRERFGMEVEFGDCRILYKETISEPVVGYGHYEPLRHYAEVHLRLDPMPRGSGITFASECPTDILSKNWQNLVKTHVFEKKHKGVLTGSELCDVKITLLTGRSHIKHTEGGDFRESTYRAVRQALMQSFAKGEVVLLEPYYSFEISVAADQIGRLMSDLQRMECVFEPPQTEEDRATVTGRGPAAGLSVYGREFISYTRGKGIMALDFDGYEPCSHQQEIADEIGYDRDRDMGNPACSVFCSHGAGFVVPWDEVENYIHCK